MTVARIKDEIQTALASHAKWKVRLRVAINTGQFDMTPEELKTDTHCVFGKWLHQNVEPAFRGALYDDVVRLHAQFHQEAGNILNIALSGDKTQAEDRMGVGCLFRDLTGSLAAKLREWDRSLEISEPR